MTVPKRPRTIQIYLPKGDPRGLRIAELTTSITRVIEVPRALLNEFQGMPEANQVGVYLLVSDDDDQDYPSVYVGQTGSVGKRLTEHHKSKDFWSRALVAVSMTNNLTQTHALYLEWMGIKLANEAGRYKVENGTVGTKPHTPAPLEADCLEIFDTLRTLVATLGQPVFEAFTKSQAAGHNPAETDTFYLHSAKYDAIGEYTAEGMVVLKGSKARKDIVASMAQTRLVPKRQGLIDEGVLKLDGNFYVFQRDFLFKSPSGAAAMVRGASSGGWVEWVNKSGETLDKIKRQSPLNKSAP